MRWLSNAVQLLLIRLHNISTTFQAASAHFLGQRHRGLQKLGATSCDFPTDI